jgi:hypothetical protein
VKKSQTSLRSRASLAIGAALLVALPLAASACAGQPITTPIDGEPICPDFEVGAAHTKMSGSLRFPVQLTIRSGKTVVFKTTILGRRSDKDMVKRILLSDDNDTFQVEWTQCENERATGPAEAIGRDTKGNAKYECGNGTSYKTEELVTKKGDPKSHALTFPAPPNPACLQGVAVAPSPTAAADAGAPDAGGEASDAGADMDAGAAGPAAPPATDAGAKADAPPKK